MNHWRDGYPRVEHGNIYTRDMLTAAEGPDLTFDTTLPVRRQVPAVAAIRSGFVWRTRSIH